MALPVLTEGSGAALGVGAGLPLGRPLVTPLEAALPKLATTLGLACGMPEVTAPECPGRKPVALPAGPLVAIELMAPGASDALGATPRGADSSVASFEHAAPKATSRQL
jgi:hypothetical protein